MPSGTPTSGRHTTQRNHDTQTNPSDHMSRSTRNHATKKAQDMDSDALRREIREIRRRMDNMPTTEFDDKRAKAKASTRADVYFEELRSRMGAAPQLISLLSGTLFDSQQKARVIVSSGQDREDMLAILDDMGIAYTSKSRQRFDSDRGQYVKVVSLWFSSDKDMDTAYGALRLIQQTDL